METEEYKTYQGPPQFRGLKRIMRRRRIPSALLADMTKGGVHYNTVRRIVKGEMTSVSTGTLSKLARALRVDVAELL